MRGKFTHQLAVLGAIGKGKFTIAEIAEHLPMGRHDVTCSASLLVRRELIERLERGQFTLTDEGRTFLAEGRELKVQRTPLKKAARRLTTLRQRAWNAMRIRSSFTIAEIAMLAADDADRNAENNLQRWFNDLEAAGYLGSRATRAKGSAPTSPGLKVWLLARDSGPLAPASRKQSGDVYDHNTGEVYPCR